MTNPVPPVLVAAVAVVALALAHPAAAHGAPPVREIDVRIATDDDGAIYGGSGFCVPEVPLPCVGDSGAVDLLALDVRELQLPDGRPALGLRILHQYDAEPTGERSFTIAFESGGSAQALALTAPDGITYASSTPGVTVLGPFEVGDGHPKAIDAIVAYETYGLQAGAQLTGIRVTSAGERDGDLMPGTWFLPGGEAAPATPNAEGQMPTTDPAAYTLAGPARLLDIDAPAGPLSVHHGPAVVQVKVTNALDGLPQFVSIVPGPGATADSPAASLEAGASRTFTLTMARATNGTLPPELTATVVSDLGAFHTLRIPIAAMAHPADPSSNTTMSHGPDGHDHDGEQDASAPALLLVALALAFVARRARRRLA